MTVHITRRTKLRGAAGTAVLAVALGLGVILTGPRPGVPQDAPIAPFVTPAESDGLRVVALGTSLTSAPGWPDVLDSALISCFGADAGLIRVAMAGANSDWGQSRIAAVAALNPSIVLIEFAINDADLRDGLSLARARANITAIVGALKAHRPDLRIVLMTTSPAQGLRGLVRLRLNAHYQQLRLLAETLGTGLLDANPRWTAMPRAARRFPDGLHPPREIAQSVMLPPLWDMITTAAGRDDCPRLVGAPPPAP